MISFRSSPERMGLAVGDVSGKGLSSALLMASLQGLVRTNLAVRQGEVARFVTELNHSCAQVDRQRPICDALFRARRRFQPDAPVSSTPGIIRRFFSGTASPRARQKRSRRDWTAEDLRSGSSHEANIGPSHVLLHDGDVLVAVHGWSHRSAEPPTRGIRRRAVKRHCSLVAFSQRSGDLQTDCGTTASVRGGKSAVG